jgi:diacylglycerol kinase family enzyme
MKALSERGCAITYRKTRGRGDAEKIAAGIGIGDCERLVVAGGDGTVNEVVNGLACAREPPPLALLPMGTANVLATEIGLSLSAESIARAIVSGPVNTISLGEVNGRRFVLMAGVGFDASVVAAVDQRLKRAIGKGAYVAASLARLAAGGFSPYTILADGQCYVAYSAVSTMARHYAGPWIIAPEAGLSRTSMQVCLFERGGRFAVARFAAALIGGRIARERDFRTIAVSTLAIEGPAACRPPAGGWC